MRRELTRLLRVSMRPTFRAIVATAVALPLSGCAMFSGGQRSGASFEEYRQYMAERTAAELADDQEEPQTVDEKVEAAQRFHRAGQYDRAMRLYFDAYRLDPEDTRARQGVAYLQLADQPGAAERVLQEVAAERPDSEMAQVGLGLARYAQGDPATALVSLERAVELEPDSALAHDALAVVLAHLGRYDDALRHARRARLLAPESPEIANNLGITYLMNGDAARGEAAIRDAIGLDDQAKPAYRNNLAVALGRQGRFSEALVEFRATGNDQTAHNNVGFLYFMQGRLDEAIGHYEMALLSEGDSTSSVLRNLNAALDARDSGGSGGTRTSR